MELNTIEDFGTRLKTEQGKLDTEMNTLKVNNFTWYKDDTLTKKCQSQRTREETGKNREIQQLRGQEATAAEKRRGIRTQMVSTVVYVLIDPLSHHLVQGRATRGSQKARGTNRFLASDRCRHQICRTNSG